MKTFVTSLLLLMLATLWTAARFTDVLADLKLTSQQVNDQLFTQLTADQPRTYLSYATRQAGKQLSVGARVEAIRAISTVVQAYVQSADFKNRYDQWLRNKYQVSDQQTAEAQQVEKASLDDVHSSANQQVTQINSAFAQMQPATLAMMLQQQIMQTQEQMVDADESSKTTLTRDLTVLRQLQSLANTKPAEFKTQYIDFMNRYMAGQLARNSGDQEEKQAADKVQAAEYKARLAQYKANADPNNAVRKRLRDFIALAESVDFGTTVEAQGYKQEFIRAEYRAQSSNWKMLYRLGREPFMTARDLARTWLTELK